MKFRLLFCIALLALSTTSILAQTDTTLKDDEGDDDMGPRRKPNAEWFIGMTSATYSYDGSGGFNEFGEPVPAGRVSETTLMYGGGYGGHIPLASLGRQTTIWLVPAAQLNIGVSSSEFSSSSDIAVDLCVPVHATIGYGGLRRKSMAWGIEGGVGFNLARRFAHDEFTFAPSVLIDLTYAPKSIYRLRFMSDIIPGALAGTADYQTWGISLVIGFGS